MIKKIKKRLRNWNKATYIVWIFVLIVVAFSVVLVNWMSRSTIDENVARRVTSEVQFLAEQQSDVIDRLIDEQFKKLATIAKMVENGLAFYDEENRDIFNVIVKENDLSMLGYAGSDGNVVTYNGKSIANIGEQTFFKDVISGEKGYSCEYLKTEDGEKVVFSTAVHKDCKIEGIIFFTKDTENLVGSFFTQSLFENKDASIIVDSEGNCLVKNKQAEIKYADKENIMDICAACNQKLKEFNTTQSGSMLFGKNNEKVFAYSKMNENGWYLVCLLDTDVARQEYAFNLIAIRRSMNILSTIFLAIIILFVLALTIQIEKSSRAKEEYKKQYDRILNLLKQMKSTILEYDVETGNMYSSKSFEEMFGYGIHDNFISWVQKYQSNHPEFDYDGLLRELNHVIEQRRTISFESIYYDDSKYEVLSVTMMPFNNENGKISNVFLCIRETGDEHSELKDIGDMFSQIPGGTYRCELDSPVRLEYAGKKFCMMLGYTRKEFNVIAQNAYYKMIVEEDREKYKQFLSRASSSPGVRNCMYSMKCKNGETIEVLDTMETIQNDSGRMYGYSVVVDITEYAKRRNIIHQEYVQMKKEIEFMQIQNSTSQMQPHFLYNALSSIREIVLTDPQYASDLIYDFTVYLRACIRSMQKSDLIPIQQEINNVEAYANIEKMRMGDRLKMTYDLQSEDFMIVPLSIQPLVENAIRHHFPFFGQLRGAFLAFHVGCNPLVACKVARIYRAS